MSTSSSTPDAMAPQTQSSSTASETGEIHNGTPQSSMDTVSVVAAATAAAVTAVAASSSVLTPKKGNSVSFIDPALSPGSPSTNTTMTMNSPSNASQGSGSVATIEHRHVNKTNKSSAFCLGMSKPVFGLVASYILFVTGAGAFLFTEFLKIPGLDDQIDELAAQVDRLEAQVDELEVQVDELEKLVDRLDVEIGELADENDRYKELNDQLNTTVIEFSGLNAEYESLNQQLNASNAVYLQLNAELQFQNDRYESLNGNLNGTVLQLREEVETLEVVTANLSATVSDFSYLNDQLNATNKQLGEQIDALEDVKANLSSTVVQYTLLNEELTNETRKLLRINNDLNDTLIDLNVQVFELKGENDRLSASNDNLFTIVSFLNETAEGIEGTFDSLSSELAGMIVDSRAVLLRTIENTYTQEVQNWDCGLLNFFASEPFSEDTKLPIGEEKYPDVILYVEENVLSEVCAASEDFERFLSEVILEDDSVENVTVKNIEQGVEVYTSALFDYYFPDEGEPGLNQTDWVAADYDCVNLPVSQRFIYGVSK